MKILLSLSCHLYIFPKKCTFTAKLFQMKIRAYFLLFLLFVALSCQDDSQKRLAEQQRDAKKKEAVFAVVNKSWSFQEPNVNPDVQMQISNWSEWRLFLTELKQKPKSSIGAFQKKAKTLSKKVSDLNNNIPAKFAVPEVKSRISALTSKIHTLDLFLNLDDIPAQKIVPIIPEINIELAALCRQMEELVQREKVPMEQGESDMLRMLDTARAIKPNLPK